MDFIRVTLKGIGHCSIPLHTMFNNASSNIFARDYAVISAHASQNDVRRALSILCRELSDGIHSLTMFQQYDLGNFIVTHDGTDYRLWTRVISGRSNSLASYYAGMIHVYRHKIARKKARRARQNARRIAKNV
jgi:hypothetical protein